ncbi:DUF4349 domain-containing protein [Actinomadura sp. 21ATH]|uniref:DUF4349 domain-containing protein n=1 Tax=Actinomadura sp. 21ATH TaxID=1735444 RepID=UPI0035BF4B5F
MVTVRTVRHAVCVLAVLLLAGALAACGGGGGSDSAGAPAPATAAQEGGGARDTTTNRYSGGGSTGSGGSASGGQGGARAPGRLPVPAGRAVVYSADLRVEAEGVEEAAAKAKQLAGAAGGYVANESSSTDPATARLTLKVPADRYAGVLDRLARQLGEKLSLRQEAEDVTEQVADVDSRVRSAEATLASFRKLLDRADTVGEVINVEEQIATRQADLEALQARQKALKASTAYATVSLVVQSPEDAPRRDEDPKGFVGGLKSGWEAFTGFLSGLALVTGWLLPFLALAAAVGVPAYLLRRRWRRAHPAPPKPPAPVRVPAREVVPGMESMESMETGESEQAAEAAEAAEAAKPAEPAREGAPEAPR